MKELVEFGFAHSGEKPGEGELAWFCATCPQPDINYKRKERDDPRHWVGHRSYVCDGCFTLVHQRSASGNNDVDLKAGEGHMVCSHKFDEYLKDAQEIPTVTSLLSGGHPQPHRIAEKQMQPAQGAERPQ